MACNENVIKNMAMEITRNCVSQNLAVDTEFVVFLIELLLLNPKYGRLFSKTINRSNLDSFVNDCVKMLTDGETPISTLKMQFVMKTSYGQPQNLIDKHLNSIDQCLRPLINEILDDDPDLEDDAAFKKLFRKISIFVILSSGLGNPGSIITLKEGMAALESVLTLDDLRVFVAIPRSEKIAQLKELMEITSGVRLFNRDCKRGGEGIPDLPFNLVDAGKACLASLSNSLISVMQRVNSLTTAVADKVTIDEETGNVVFDVQNPDITEGDYKHILATLCLHRQHEVSTRAVLGDAEQLARRGASLAADTRRVLDRLHAALQYKTAVPATTVFPLFKELWQIWRSMQNVMFLMSTINRVMSMLSSVQDQKVPQGLLNRMLEGKRVVTDQDRMNSSVHLSDKISLGSLTSHVSSFGNDGQVQFLGFCAMCLCVGALVPSNMRIGFIKWKGLRYGFCNVKMATRFSKDPQRYINEVLEFARNNPHVINLLNISNEVEAVKDVENLVTKHVPKTKTADKDVQTDTHPIEKYIEKDYTWDLWEWKRRACQWATIVKCKTHSTQTHYSHLRSEVQCQTVTSHDKGLQTKKDSSVNTSPNDIFLWGLRGHSGGGQHAMELCGEIDVEKEKAQAFTLCSWPCVEEQEIPSQDKS